MSCAYRNVSLSVGSFRANALGYGQTCKPNLPLKSCEPPICDGDYSRPFAYEASRLQNMVAYPTDGLGSEYPIATMRIVKSAGHWAIGTAVSTITNRPAGFLVNVKTLCVTLLQETTASGEVYVVSRPRALVIREDGVTVFGNADFEGVDYPAIAHVNEALCVRILVGCGCDSEDQITYYDAIVNACDPCTAYIAGSRNDRATVFLVNLNTGVIIDTTSLYLDTPDASSLATCVTVVASCMLVLGVQISESSSMLWTLSLDTLQEVSFTAGTSYNDVVTRRLRLPVNCLSVAVLRVFAQPCGSLYAVTAGTFNTTGTNMPSHGVVVYHFTPDTLPDMEFAVSGISIWFDPRATSTRPTDATYAEGTVYVVGNSYDFETPPQDVPTFYNPCLPFLSVDVLRTNVALPSPFLVQVRVDGSVCPLLSCLKSCAAATFANTVLVYPGTAVVVGDVWFHLNCPSQSAGLLLVEMVLKPCPRIVNSARVSVPVFNSPVGCCAGPIVVDRLCGDTTLQVAGPVVVGCPCETALPLPGAIAFDPVKGAFVGFDGLEWKTFTFS